MENLEQYLMSEAFDTIEGYGVINMKPNSPSPQIFLIKNDNDEPLIVRMMALSTGGDKLRVLKPTDDNVIVELMSINERGRHIVLQGGIGKNPMKTIVTVFDTVYNNLNHNVVKSIMFRFQTKKMKGQARSIVRILDRLTQIRAKGKYAPLEEMQNFTNKFSYVVMHKKRIDINELPGAKNISKDLKKVSTSVGDVYVDEKTGNRVSKSEAVAEAIAKTVSEITPQEFIQKTKLSRQDIMRSQYGGNPHLTQKDKIEKWEYLNSKPPIKSPVGDEDEQAIEFVQQVNTGFKEYDFAKNLNSTLETHVGTTYNYSNIIENLPIARLLHENINDEKIVISILKNINDILNDVNIDNMQDKIFQLASLANNYGLENATLVNRIIVEQVCTSFKNHMGWWYGKIKFKTNIPIDIKRSIAVYCGSGYSNINEYLIGTGPGTPTLLDTIESLDECFDDYYTKLPKGVKLYRGMSLEAKTIKQTLESKVFYFRNYVSTSLAPVIFIGNFADVSKPISSETKINIDANTSDEIINIVSGGNENAGISIGVVISGAEKLNVIVPFSETKFEDECEVILPRGTAIRFDKMVSSGTHDRRIFSEASVIDPSTLTESEVLYDGDLFVETGEIKPLDKNRKFILSEITSELEIAENAMKKAKQMEVLADAFANTNVPYKFMQC